MKDKGRCLQIKVASITLIALFILHQIKDKVLFTLLLEILYPIILIAITTWIIIVLIQEIPGYYKLKKSIHMVIRNILIIASIFLVLVFVSSESTRNTVLDIPAFYNKNFENVEGIAIWVFNHEGGGKYSKQYTDFTINNIRFSIESEMFNSIKEDELYSVKYLPHSKMVLEINEEPAENK